MAIVYPSADGHKVIISEQVGSYDSKDIYVGYIATVVGAAGDTLNQVASPMCIYGQRFRSFTGGIFSSECFFGPTSEVLYQPDKGLIRYYSGEPIISIYGLDGNRTNEIRIVMEPDPVTNADRQGIDKYLDEQIESAPIEVMRENYKLAKEYTIIPDSKSYWASVMVDDAGYFWLRHHIDYSLEKEERNKPSFRVLSPEGEYLGDVMLPEERFTISRGHLLTFDRNLETGEETPVVYRIIPAVAGLEYP